MADTTMTTSLRPMKRPADISGAPKKSLRPEPRPETSPDTDKLESKKETQDRIDSYSSGYKKGGTVKMKKGGMMEEGSAKDMREDKVKAKKAGMTMKKWEASAADMKHDAGMKRGGAVKKMASGGSVRGAGCAIRGKTGAKEY